jgi:hypothetical protein
MTQYAGSRFGQDAPARISVATGTLVEATERLPGEPLYQPLVPFVPPSIVNGNNNNNGLTENGQRIWTQYPSLCNLVFYQGDDVIIPLFFQDPNDTSLDMSNDAGWAWEAQVRVTRNYESDLVHDLSTVATFIPPVDPAPGYTQVEMFLPRMENDVNGVYSWEIYSVGPSDLSRFPKPDDVAPEDWPPPDMLRTWLWGAAYILPRGTTTDYLPAEIENGTPAITTGGYFVGPNGRVP